MNLRLRRQTPARIDSAVIERQRQLLAEKEDRILALEVELEATRALSSASESELVQTYCQLARVYRAHRDFLRAQIDLVLELLDARRLREGRL